MVVNRRYAASLVNCRSVTSRLLVLSFITAVTGCATQSPMTPMPSQSVVTAPQVDSAEVSALRDLISLQERLYRVGAPLLVKNTDLCRGNARNLLGFTAKNKHSYTREFINAATVALELDDRLQVMTVLAGSGASKAGIRRGDILTAVEDRPMPQGQGAERQASALLAPLVTGKSSVKLSLLRAGTDTPATVNVPLTHACAFGIELGQSDHVNSYADGHRVMLTRGMMNFARTDEELAYVLAKGMAHNALAHPQKLRVNGTVGGVIDNLVRMHPDMSMLSGTAGIKLMPVEMDAAADALALYMAARAGYGIDRAGGFWQRLASQYPATVLNGYNAIHSPIATRLPTINNAVEEIKSKQAHGRSLLP